MRALVVTAVVLCGCSNLVGIGDLPAPAHDAAPDAPTCPDGMMRCGTACFDLTSSIAHCGACDIACPEIAGGTTTCEASTCKLDSDEAFNRSWSLTAPTPFLAFWKDGTLLAASGSTASLLSTGATPASTPFTALAGRPSIMIPANPALTEVAITHYGFWEGRTQGDVQHWMNGIHGCCGTSSDGWAIDAVLGRMFTGHGVTELDTDTGATVLYTDVIGQHGSPFFVTATALYLPRLGTALVTKFDRNHVEQWTATLGDGIGITVGDGAIASDGGIIVATATGDKLTRLRPNGTKAWEIDVVSPGAPITTSTGLVVLGARKNDVPQLCAFDVTTGTEAWCTPTDAPVIGVLAGDDGVIYTAIASTPTLFGYNRATGKLNYTFRNIPAPQEIILRQHHVYASGGGSVTSFEVPAVCYDASSWPVRFHDNQRTRGTQASLEF